VVKYTICPWYRFNMYPVTAGNPGLHLAGYTRLHVPQTIFTQTWPIISITNAGFGALKSHVPTKRVVSHFQNMGPAALRHNKLVNILAQNLCTTDYPLPQIQRDPFQLVSNNQLTMGHRAVPEPLRTRMTNYNQKWVYSHRL